MEYSFTVETFRKEDCTLRVCYQADGVADRRAFVKLPLDVMQRQDENEFREYIIKKAPIAKWEAEKALQTDSPTERMQDLLGVPMPAVTSEEHAAVTQPEPESPYDPVEVV